MKAKVFIADNEDLLQKKLDDFLKNNLIDVENILQSSSAHFHTYQTTITIFYTDKMFSREV